MSVKLRMAGPFSLREKARMRRSNKVFSLFYFPHPDPLPKGEGDNRLNLMAVLGNAVLEAPASSIGREARASRHVFPSWSFTAIKLSHSW